MAKIKTPRNSPEIIARIAALMEEKRYNPGSLASALERKRGWGYAFMNNQILISAQVLAQIAAILGVSMDSLWTGLDNPGDKTTLEEYVRIISRDEINKQKSQ